MQAVTFTDCRHASLHSYCAVKQIASAQPEAKVCAWWYEQDGAVPRRQEEVDKVEQQHCQHTGLTRSGLFYTTVYYNVHITH